MHGPLACPFLWLADHPGQARIKPGHAPRATRSAQSRTTRMWLSRLVTSTRCQPAASSQQPAASSQQPASKQAQPGKRWQADPAHTCSSAPVSAASRQDGMHQVPKDTLQVICARSIRKCCQPQHPLCHALTDRSPLAVPCLIVSCAQRNRNSAGFLVSSGSGATKKPQAGPALAGPSSSGRQVGQNKLLSKSNRYSPMASKCKLCKGNVSLEKATYCQGMCYPPLDDLAPTDADHDCRLCLQEGSLCHLWQADPRYDQVQAIVSLRGRPLHDRTNRAAPIHAPKRLAATLPLSVRSIPRRGEADAAASTCPNTLPTPTHFPVTAAKPPDFVPTRSSPEPAACTVSYQATLCTSMYRHQVFLLRIACSPTACWSDSSESFFHTLANK